MDVTKLENFDTSCTACGACQNICPTSAITMTEDKMGFMYPTIDYSKCIDCSQCINVCYLHKEYYRSTECIRCYAVWAQDEIREQSSSGGAFTLVASEILNEGGYVYGAAYINGTKVRHVCIEDVGSLDKLQTSKYIQSDIQLIYRDVKEKLKTKKKVLFTGTPCQIEGLYLFLRNEPSNLYTVDILCHGVPSQNLFDRYLEEEYGHKKIRKVNFRDKSEDGWTYKLKLKVEVENGYDVQDIQHSSYYRAFNERLSLREVCGKCAYATDRRMGDITLGDFWEIWGYDRSLDDRKGTSLVMVNSMKGEELIRKICTKAKLKVEVPLEQAKRGNLILTSPLALHPARDDFFEDVKTKGLKMAVSLHLDR